METTTHRPTPAQLDSMSFGAIRQRLEQYRGDESLEAQAFAEACVRWSVTLPHGFDAVIRDRALEVLL